MLDVVRIRGRLQIVGELGVGEWTSEPGGAPEKKRHEDEEEREDEDDVGPAAGARALRRIGCGRRRASQNSLPRFNSLHECYRITEREDLVPSARHPRRLCAQSKSS